MTAKNCTIPVTITVDGPASNHTCPHCGYCPHCKRSFRTYPLPYTPVLPWYPQPIYIGDPPPIYIGDPPPIYIGDPPPIYIGDPPPYYQPPITWGSSTTAVGAHTSDPRLHASAPGQVTVGL